MIHNFNSLQLLFACILVNSNALALEISPGNLPQADCSLSRLYSIGQAGNVELGNNHLVIKNKIDAVDKLIKTDSMIFYVAGSEGKKIYMADKQIEIKDASPLTRDIAILQSQKYYVVGSFRTLQNKKYDIVQIGDLTYGFKILVNESGYICSNRLDKNLIAVGLPTVYQELPFLSSVEETPESRTISSGIVLKKFDDLSIGLEISGAINGKIIHSKTLTFDINSGLININGLVIKFTKEDAGIRVNRITEPNDISAWLRSLFK